MKWLNKIKILVSLLFESHFTVIIIKKKELIKMINNQEFEFTVKNVTSNLTDAANMDRLLNEAKGIMKQ